MVFFLYINIKLMGGFVQSESEERNNLQLVDEGDGWGGVFICKILEPLLFYFIFYFL